jgi:PAS domain S-box-containing protein
MPTKCHYTLLIVDDSQDNQEKYQCYLTTNSDITYTVLAVKSAKEALERCNNLVSGSNQSALDTILLKSSLSDGNGLEVLVALKAKLGKSCPPVVILGDNNIEEAVKAVKEGAEDYLVLSQLTPVQFQVTIKSAIENAKLWCPQHFTEQEATLQSFYDNAPMLMGVVELTDNDIIHVYDNCAACRFFGKEPNGTTGKLASELGVTQSVIQNWSAKYLESQVCQEPVQFEYIHEEGRKHPRCLFVTVFPISSALQRRPRFCYVAEDITKRRRVEEGLRQSKIQLQRQLAEIELIYQSAPIGLNIIDTDLRFIRINERLAEINGLPVEEHIGRTVRELLPHVADEAEPLLRRVLEGESLLNVEITGETPAQPGVQRTWLEHFLPLKMGEQIIGINTVCEEITARKQYEIELEQLLAERERVLQQEQAARLDAERANRVKDEFLAILSHELRTPLNPILGWVKLLKSGKLNAVKTTEAYDTIERNAKLQVSLIEDLLDVSRILRGKLILNISTVNLKSIISAALETVNLAAQTKNIQINTSLESNVGEVLGDPVRLQQIVWNLLSNAVKFTPQGGRIKITLVRAEPDAQISVSDTGKGISSEFLPHIFEHFRQEDASITRAFGGLGLGLAIVSNLVELHGGTIEVNSLGVGQGATFTVRLPLVAPTPDTSVNSHKTI